MKYLKEIKFCKYIYISIYRYIKCNRRLINISIILLYLYDKLSNINYYYTFIIIA